MKKVFAVSIVFLICAGVTLAGAFIERITAKSDGENIMVEWKTGEETNVKQFEVERSNGGTNSFMVVGSVDPKGSNSYYVYTDKSAYKPVGSVYAYRIKIVDKDPNVVPSYSNAVSVSHSVSSVKRTWGSIKAMFR
jgi:hypothetical protein